MLIKMLVKILYLYFPFIFTNVLSNTLENEIRSDCTFDVKFHFDKDVNNLPNVSCFRSCKKESQTLEQALNHQSFYYHDDEVEKKYERMVEITVSDDGTIKCVLVPINANLVKENISVQDEEEKMFLAPEKLVSRSVVNCPERYDYVKDVNTCIRFSDNELSWADASRACQADGGTLVIVDSEEKQMAFDSAAVSVLVSRKTQINKRGMHLWIGLSDIKKEGKFEWVDGTPVNYLRWFTNEPNNFNNSEDCVIAIFIGISYWDDRSCEGYHKYVCESRPKEPVEISSTTPNFSTTPAPSTTILPFAVSSGTMTISICPTGWWKSHTSETCYHIGEDGRTFDQSKYYCQSVGGSLASIPNYLEMQYVKELLERNSIISIWIGLTDKSMEGSFRWIDETTLNYTSWADNQPDNWKNNEDCVAIDQTWKYLWIDMSCEIKVKQLCQRSPNKLAVKRCTSGSIVVRQVTKNFLIDDLICDTKNTTSLVCLQEDGWVRTINSNQFLLPLVIVSALLGLHFLSLILVSFYFCKFYKMQKRPERYTKTQSGNPERENVNMAYLCPPTAMKMPKVPAPLSERKGGQVRDNDEDNIYDGPEYDTEKYGYYINPRIK